MNLLFLDDNDTIRQIAKQIFLNSDHNIIVADSVKTAIQAVECGVDWAILDLQLQGENVEDVLRVCRDRGVHVFIISGYVGNYQNLLERYNDIIKRCFVKPDGMFLLKAAIDELER